MPRGVADDPALPQLARAADPAALAARWARALRRPGGVTCGCSSTCRASAPCWASSSRRDAGHRQDVPKDRAAHHARLVADLGAALRRAHAVPRLLDCWEDLGLVLQEWVPGDAGPDYEHLGAEAALVERLGAALAELHAATVGRRHSDLAAHVRRTCGAGLESLGADWPQMAAMAYELEGAIYARDARLAHTLRPCHGDYAPRQMFVARSTCTRRSRWSALSDPALRCRQFPGRARSASGDAGRELADDSWRVLERRGVGRCRR
jgi:hypothetical protein